MTYIEFYDRVSVENIATCLSYMPKRVIIIGVGTQLDARIEQYKRVFHDRGHKDVEIEPKNINKTNLTVAVKQLTWLIEHIDDDIVFDITGGDEVLVLALGMVYAEHPDKKIQIHKINLHTGKMYDCDRDGETVFENAPQLSIRENIRIYGGEVPRGDVDSERTYHWQLSKDFVADVDKMWSLCRDKERSWNVYISVLRAICGDGEQEKPSCLTVTSSVEDVENRPDSPSLKQLDDKFVQSLLNLGLLKAFNNDGETITVTFKNPQVKRCLTMEGQVLELKIYLCAKNATVDGQPVYHDVLNGVKIDWDGLLHDDEEQRDVANEIDVMMMHGVVPIFVSCKNGGVPTGELYKLQTVARRFGGPYARMVLVAPYLNPVSSPRDNEKKIQQSKNDARILERAEDMGIIVLYGNAITRADDATLSETLGNLWCN